MKIKRKEQVDYFLVHFYLFTECIQWKKYCIKANNSQKRKSFLLKCPPLFYFIVLLNLLSIITLHTDVFCLLEKNMKNVPQKKKTKTF